MVDIFSAIPIGEWLRIALVFSHVVICGFAISAVVKADIKIIVKGFCREDIESEAKEIAYLLLGLWVTGLAIIYMDTGFSAEILMSKAKLLLKLLCVLMLTINGLVLHHVSFPVLTRDSKIITRTESVVLSVTGALSTSHWMLAAFIGMSAPLARLPLDILVQAYVFFFCSIILVALTFVPVVRSVKKKLVISTARKVRVVRLVDKSMLSSSSPK